LLLIVAGTSFFRSRMPYEVFYIVHHLVFAMFIVSIVHTFDIDQRKALKDRSQTWTWFSFSLLYYITDRVYMHMSNSFVLDVVEATALSNSDGTGPKMVVLRLRKPIQIQFYPGQYLSLNISNIDSSWHPFSFASGRGEASGTIGE
jgi:predicted ferric reductase